MQDGRTVQRETGIEDGVGWAATLVEVAGGAEGNEHAIGAQRVVMGRGPDVDLAFDDEEMSAQHAAFEQTRGGVTVTDLDSTNGTRVNGQPVTTCVLAHGDRVDIGGHAFELLLEKREKPPRTWVVDA